MSTAFPGSRNQKRNVVLDANRWIRLLASLTVGGSKFAIRKQVRHQEASSPSGSKFAIRKQVRHQEASSPPHGRNIKDQSTE
ncbi:hypothetical protein VE02_03834 [Pseudogymnoascus sp. 03VT05]|nr:hypothetical protein VE02_03834 [Pseudogymnoascus sp. 03VT05]